MASITQTIPNYIQGISEQPDELLQPGQLKDAVNVFPDITRGLIKRPGSKLIKTLTSAATTDGCWFSYYRDANEQWIGKVSRNGAVDMWLCNTIPGVAEAGHHVATSTNSYLAHTNDGDIQFLTIQDYTYIVNRTKTVNWETINGVTTKTPSRPDGGKHAYVELKQTANARQYSLNIWGTGNVTAETIKTITRLKHKDAYSWASNEHGQQPRNADNTGKFTGADLSNTAFSNSQLRFQNSDGEEMQNSSQNYADYKYWTERVPFHSRTMDNQGQYNRRHKGSCPDVSSEIHNTNDTDVLIYDSDDNLITDGSRKNCIFRFTVKGVSGTHENSGHEVNGHDYTCQYNYDVELLHGGTGFEVGDWFEFKHVSKGYDLADSVNAAGITAVSYQVEVQDIEQSEVKCTVAAAQDGLIRPEPTPFDTDTAVSATTILGGMQTEITTKLGSTNTFTVDIIGNGLYIKSSEKFNIASTEKDLLNITTYNINDASKLPMQCKHNYKVKVNNSDTADDDYYLTFQGTNSTDGPGRWIESAEPEINSTFDSSSMPHRLRRNSDLTFTLESIDWKPRAIGDDTTNTQPSFVGAKINKLLFWRNRLVMLSGENVILSRPDVAKHHFWHGTALAVTPLDPIDIAVSSVFPTDLYDGIVTNSGLLLFSANQQFLLTTDSDALTPETAKINTLTTYGYNTSIPPISLGTTLGFVDNAGQYSRFFEIANIRREGEPTVVDASKVVSRLLPKDIDLIANSAENTCIMLGQSGSDIVYGYRYFNIGEQRQQAAWFKWQLNDKLLYHTILDDTYYAILQNKNFVRMELKDSIDTTAITSGSDYYPVHLDNYSDVESGSMVWNADTQTTTFTIPTGISPTKSDGTPQDIVVYMVKDGGVKKENIGRYEVITPKPTTDPTVYTVELEGNWKFYYDVWDGNNIINTDLVIGNNFEMSIRFPTIYPSRSDGKAFRSDTNSSLVIHRVKFNLSDIGLYETLVKRIGKADSNLVFEAAVADKYLANKEAIIDKIETVPIYERNTNMTLYLKSSHPAPAILNSLSWEGDYSPMHYKRV